jgi:beta-1,4-N-acetylglucosaminyltransferase
MIFVTVGSTDFDRLVQRVDELGPKLATEIVCQIGNGRYLPGYCSYFRFAASLIEYVKRSDLVISHGGQGTLLDVIQLGKPLIGVSNPDRRDNHQDDVLSKLSELNHLIWCRSLNDLEAAVDHASRARFARYAEPSCAIPEAIYEFLVRRRLTYPVEGRAYEASGPS